MRKDRRTGYWDRARETMSSQTRAKYQADWLRGLVQHAYARAPGVRRRFDAAGLRPSAIKAPEDLAKLPVMKKAQMPDLQKADPPFGGFCTVPLEKVRRVFVSPGPIHEPIGPEFSPWRSEVGFYAGGFRPGDIVVNTFSYHLTPAAHMLDEGLLVLGCTVIPTGAGNTDAQVKVIADLRVTGYVGTPSFLMTILKRAQELGVGALSLEVAHVGGEMFPESLRQAFAHEHRMVAHQGYGTADLGILAYECFANTGMHLVDDVIVQICDPQSGEPLSPGQTGEVVATVRHESYPMLRFGTGDLSYFATDLCPCGRTSWRLPRIVGRADEVTKVRGMFIHPRQADEIASRFPAVGRYRVVVTRTAHQDEMTFQVELKEPVDADALKAQMEAAIRDVMKLRGEVLVVPAGAIPEGAKRIDDQRKWD